jgi:hypothetical protein
MHTLTNFRTFITTIFFSLSVVCYAGEEISKKELIIIHDKAITLIKDYQNAINKIGSEILDINRTKSNIESLIDLCVNRKTLVYNDLDPAHQLSEFYEIETYASNLSLWYPDGQTIEMDIDNSKVSNIMDHGEGIYSIDVAVAKKIKGNYINKVQNTNVEQLLFRIAFILEKQKADKFKIAGVRNAKGEIKPLDNLSVAEVKSADLSKEDVLKVKEYCKSIVNDYINYLSLIGNSNENADDKELYKQAIKNIFVQGDNNVFNDLEENARDKYLSIQKYIDLYTELYPVINNISVNNDSASYSKVMRNDNGSLNIYMYANKFFSAKKGKDLYRSQNKIIVKINFTKKDKTFADFKIASIDNSGINEALASSQVKSQNISSFGALNKLTRKGMYLSLNSISGFSKIVNKNIAELDLNKQYHEWKIKPAFSYGGQVRILYMFNELLGAETGLGYQFLKTTYSLSSENVPVDQSLVDSTGLMAFVDHQPYNLNAGDTYYKIMQVSYDSIVKLQTLTLPLYVNLIVGKPNKISFIFKAGVDMMYVLKSQYSASGYKKFFAYLPDPQTTVQFHFLFPEDDFNGVVGLFDNTTDIKDKEAKIKKFAVNGVISAGVDIPLGYFLSVNADFTFKTCLNDLATNKKEYVDIFGQTKNNPNTSHQFAHKPTKMQQYLLEIGIKYKF